LHLDIKEVTLDVEKLTSHLRIWELQETRSPLHSAAQRILFAFYNIPEIKEIRANFGEYRKWLLQVLSIKSHHEARKGQDDLLKMMNEMKASYAEFESRKGSRLSLEEIRLSERQKRYLEWENLDFGEKGSPGKVAELQDFLEQKAEKCLGEEVQWKHLDDITRRLSGVQASNRLTQSQLPRDQNPEPELLSVSSFARRGRSAHFPVTSGEDWRTRSGSSGAQVVPALIESTPNMSHSRSSASSRSSLHRKRDSSQGSNSTSISLRDRFLMDSGYHSSPSTLSRQVSPSNFGVQSSAETTRSQPNNHLTSAFLRLSFAEGEESGERSRVPIYGRTQNITSGPSASNLEPRSRRYYVHTTQPNNLPPGKRQEVNILVVSGNNMGKFQLITSLVAPNLPPVAVSKLAQTYFELLRLCSINTNNHWLFDRVESAGICINPQTDIDSDFAMRLLASSNFKYGDFPNEKDRLLSRIEATRPAVFHEEYLKQFNYILCLDRNSYDAVNRASSEQQRVRSDQLIRGVLSLGLDHLAGQIMTQIEAENVAVKIKSMVESVMEKRLDWKHPDPKLAQRRRRTLQMTVPREMVGRIIGKGGVRINALREDTGCSIQVFDEVIRADRSLILATGQVENLIRVEERILAVPPLQNSRR
jgi:hypothetical protein